MRRSFTRILRIKVVVIISILLLFSTIFLRLLNKEKSLSREPTCIEYAKRLTHNLTTVNGWETNKYFSSMGLDTENTMQYWNEDDRFRKFNLTTGTKCSIIYCGVNTRGTDGLYYAKEYPSCSIWFFEPVSIFYEQFVHSLGWERLMTSEKSWLYNIYPYGLSNRSKFVIVNDDAFSERQSFSLIRKQQATETHQRHKLIIRDVFEIMFELKILNRVKTNVKTIVGELTLMHMNCEGCEYEVLQRLIDTDLIKYIRYIQFGSHRPLAIQSKVAEHYCSLQKKLNVTHNIEFGIPWGWERWVLY